MTSPFGPDVFGIPFPIAAAFLSVVLAVLAFAVGWAVGRRWRGAGLRALERGLRDLAAGDENAHVDVAADDPAARAAGHFRDVTRRLRERNGRAERRGVLLSEAGEQLGLARFTVTDKDLTVVAVTRGLAELRGLDIAEIEGRPLGEILAPGALDELRAVAAERRPFALDAELLHGGAAHVRGSWLAGPVELLAIAFEPVTPPPVPVEPAAPVSEGWAGLAAARLAEILAALPEGVLVVSEGRITVANGEARRWLGEAIVGTLLKDLVQAEDLLLVLDRVGRAAGGERVESVACRLLPPLPGLAPRDVELFASGISGAPAAAAIVLRDLGPERRADRRARIHEARLLSVIDAVEDGLVMFTVPPVSGSPWRVGLVNRRTLELFALDGSATRGAPEEEFRALVAHRFRDPAAFAALLEGAAADPERVHEATLDLAGPGAPTVELVLRPVLGLEGELLGRLLVLRDITRHAEVERQLVADAAALGRSRESLQRAYEQLTLVNRDLEKKTGELDRLNRELVELDRARAQLLGDVSHELQTPLVSIRGYCQMILEGRLGKINDEQRRGLEVALRNVDRMVELINNLLSLARSERDTPLAAQPIDPGEVIAEVVERQHDAAQRKGVSIEVDNVDPGARMMAEREGLVQVLDNLIGNGIKFNRAGGRVLVGVHPGPSGYVKLEVSDTGIGIPQEEHQRIFERFYRGRGAAGTQGSGIGLATVKNIVQRHGGALELQSSIGQGTLIRILWPRASAASGQPTPPSTAAV